MNKVLRFDLDTSFVKIKEIIKNKDFIELEFWAISDEYPNNNKSHFPFNTFQQNIDNKVFYNKPILGKFNNLTDNYETHVYRKKYDPEFDMEYYDYEDGERPLGIIRESDDIRIETDEQGLHWIVFTAVIWVKYNYKGVKKILKSQSGKVSVEVTVTKYHKDENDIEIFDEWVFDGITILGYRPNTTILAKEGINNARLTINDLMNEKTFSNQLKTLCFAYEELDNNDINETQSHLYREENNNEMEGCVMSYAEKRNALESILSTFIMEEDHNVDFHVYDFNENSVFYHFDGVDYKTEYSIDHEGNIGIDIEHKVIIDKTFVETCQEKEKPLDDEKECKMNDVDNDNKEDNPKEDDECGKVGCSEDEEKDTDEKEVENSNSEDEKKEEENSEKTNLSSDNSVDNFTDDSDDNSDTEEDDKDDKDDKDDSDNTDDKHDEKFLLNDEMYTGEELVNKYMADMSQKNDDYQSLQQQYSDVLSQKLILEEKVKKYEEQEANEQMLAFCEKVSNVAKKEGFNEDQINSLMEKCKNKEFSDFEEALKEVAYIVYMNKNNDSDNEENKNTKEFSVEIVENKQKNVQKIKEQSSFESLENYVKK